jgi:hypothetical protein
VVLAEPSLTLGGQKHMAAELAKGDVGYRAVWSPPQPHRLVPGKAKSDWDAVPGGTGILSRRPVPVQKVQSPLSLQDRVKAEEPDLIEEGRLLHAALPLGSGHTVLHVLAFYGYSGARSGNAWAKRKNELALRQLFRYGASLGRVPVVIAGDFNDECATSPTMAQALQSGKWWDAALLEEQKKEPPDEPPPTYVAGGASSRIDAAYLNGVAKAAFTRCWTGDPEHYLFPGHRPLFVEFQWADMRQQVTKLRKPKAIPLPPPSLHIPGEEGEGGKA